MRMTVDSSSMICLANGNAGSGYSVARFDFTGNRLLDITDPLFDDVQAVATDNAGNHYVLSNNNRTIVRYDSNWQNKYSWTFQYSARDIVAEFGNYVVVLKSTDGVNGWVQVFDRNGNQQYLWQISGANTSLSIALTPDGNSIVVCDTNNHRILKYSVSGSYEGVAGSYGIDDGKFNFPTCIDIDSGGIVYVGDAGNYRIQIFNQSFTFLGKYVGGQGSGDGQFWAMYGIGIDQNKNIYTTDSTYGNIQKFKKNP